jgi:hypothetical protein
MLELFVSTFKKLTLAVTDAGIFAIAFLTPCVVLAALVDYITRQFFGPEYCFVAILATGIVYAVVSVFAVRYYIKHWLKDGR